MALLLKAVRHNPLLWLLAFVPVLFVAAKLKPESHPLLFALSVAANSGRSAWFVGVLLPMVYLVFATSLNPLPPKAH